MQTLKVEILSDDVQDYTVDDIHDLAQTISKSYGYGRFRGVHVKITDEDTGIVIDFDPYK